MYQFEKVALSKGYQYIAGTDEVGRGPLAGPVVAAAVVLNPNDIIKGLDDSKKLSEKKRDTLYSEIYKRALDIAFVYIWPEEIDQINIYQASKKAMIESIKKLKQCDYILSDAMPLGTIGIPFESIIKGDSKSASIAAASIVAKVERDRYMIKMSKRYPEYGFDKHKGYPTKVHLEALRKYGVTPIHRKSYKPVEDVLNQQIQFEL
jgi:ribonuclease HII